MEFDKKTNSETEKPAQSEATTKEKKKRGRRKQLHAPMPVEVVAEEHKNQAEKDAEKTRTKKTKKKTKKAVAPGAVTREEVKKDTGEPVQRAASEKPADVQEKHSEQEQKNTSAPEVAAESSAATTVEHDHEPVDTFEKVILPHQVTGEEGELFISDRLRKITEDHSSEEAEELVVTPANASETEATPEEPEDPQDPLRHTSSTATHTASPKRAAPTASMPATSPRSIPPVQPAFASGGLPPHTPPGGNPNLPPPPPVAPNLAPNPTASSFSPDRMPDGNRVVERRNLVAGILLGGIIEHIRHKRREKRVKAAHEKEVKHLKNEQQFQYEQQRRSDQKAERTKTTLEKQLERLQQLVTPPSKHVQKSPENKSQPKGAEALLQPMAEQPIASVKKAPEAKESINPFSEPGYVDRLSEPTAAAAVKAQEKPRTPEKPVPIPGQQPESLDEPAELPPDRRVEASAWHRIEVDKKTGKAVEDPSLAYGHEFQQEQHQEQLRRQIAEASMETETVKQTYMPIIDKTKTTSYETHDPSGRSHSQESGTPSPVMAVLQRARDAASDSNGVDAALWVALILIIIAIIALL